MKIAIMQPYFFPYVGYFELIKQVDLFVFFNDVQYTKGWINRNKIRSNHGFQYLTVPIIKSPQKTNINEIKIDNATEWKIKHVKSISTTYGKKANCHPILMHYKALEPFQHLYPLLRNTVEHVANYLGLKAKFIESSSILNNGYQATERIIHICKTLGANNYVNAVGGRDLYSYEVFQQHGIELEIMPTTSHENKLSILDLCIGDGILTI
jgi:hypothetical protein